MLTDPGDIVLDIFGGSNTTGSTAEDENRRWISFEQSSEYMAASAFRFLPKGMKEEELKEIYQSILQGKSVDLSLYQDNELPLFSASK